MAPAVVEQVRDRLQAYKSARDLLSAAVDVALASVRRTGPVELLGVEVNGERAALIVKAPEPSGVMR